MHRLESLCHRILLAEMLCAPSLDRGRRHRYSVARSPPERRPARTMIIIDGYNLLFAIADFSERGFEEALEGARGRLLARLATLERRGGEKVRVVFDCRRPTSGPRQAGTAGGVEVVFASPRRSADDEIRAMVAGSTAPRHILVVTSDRELAEACRKLGARVTGAKAFYSRLVRLTDALDAEAAERQQKTRAPSAAEVARWLRIFGEGERDDLP